MKIDINQLLCIQVRPALQDITRRQVQVRVQLPVLPDTIRVRVLVHLVPLDTSPFRVLARVRHALQDTTHHYWVLAHAQVVPLAISHQVEQVIVMRILTMLLAHTHGTVANRTVPGSDRGCFVLKIQLKKHT